MSSEVYFNFNSFIYLYDYNIIIVIVIVIIIVIIIVIVVRCVSNLTSLHSLTCRPLQVYDLFYGQIVHGGLCLKLL